MEQTVWGAWREYVGGGNDIAVFPLPECGIWAWQIKSYVHYTVYAASYAPSLDAARADAHAAIAAGALTIPPIAPAVWAVGRRLARDWEYQATLFRRENPITWVGFHAGSKLTVITNDERAIPHLTAARIHTLNEQRRARD